MYNKQKISMKGDAIKTVRVAILGMGRSGRNIHAEYLITAQG